MSITNNNISVLAVSKDSLTCWPVAIDEKLASNLIVSQNYPNPMGDRSVVNVELNQGGNLSLEVYNIVGQKVLELQQGFVNAGNHKFILNRSQMNTGIYFYTVTLNSTSVTRKMIVK